MERKLAAILAADVVGYSRLMAENEADTFDRLRAHREELFEPEIAKHHGRIFKLMGDGLFAEFGSVVDAVECAAMLQREMARRNGDIPEDRRIQVRIGINLGDVIVEGEDRHGDGINIAARLQGLAEPGGITVSGTAYDHLQGKVDIALEFAGEQQVKNIARPVRVYRVRLDRLITDRPTLALPEKPSIAVLPFANLSRDPEQEYFADGIVDELITALSRFRHLFVIARNSSFTYKGRAVDVKLVGRELGVRYVLEGSVRKSGNRVRISGQLIDAATGAHLWADRFEGTLDDIFELQDHVTASVVGAISPRLEEAEIERAQRKPTESLDAYDYFLRGMAAFHQWTREGSTEALSNFYHAIEIDPKFASAYGMAARCYPQRKTSGWVMDAVGEAAEAERLARRAAALGRDDATALSTAGFTLAYIGRGLDEGDTLIDRALQLNPNLAWAWLCSGWVKVWLGKPELALEQLARSMRLSPHDPQLFRMQTAIAYAHFSMGQFSEALSWAEKAFLERPDQVSAVRILAASSAIAGQQDRAMQALERLRELDPTLRLSNLKNVLPLRRPEILNSLTEGLRKAGLPE